MPVNDQNGLTQVAPRVLSVTELNRSVRLLLEQTLPLAWVAGEISNLTVAASGHWYFALKDKQAQVRCVMFRSRAMVLDFRPQEGMQVELRATPALYEARGEFQLNVDFMRRAGLGALFEQFERLKARLAAEGLFASERKRVLPAFPHRIGIVTSPAAAALRDVLTTLRRRMPGIEVVLYPTPVQGEGAALQIAQALRKAGERAEVELLIACRGGGSIEDLWAFNEEVVARAIAASPLPVISGVGHETDVTIADFVADRRAPTPTAAAEIVAPERASLLRQLEGLQAALSRQTIRAIEQRAQHLDSLARRLCHPAERIERQHERLQHLARRLAGAALRHQGSAAARISALHKRLLLARPQTDARQRRLDQLVARLAGTTERRHALHGTTLHRLADSLEHLNPLAVLGRGYALVRDESGRILSDAATVEPSAPIRVYLAHGRLDAEVTGVDGHEQFARDV